MEVLDRPAVAVDDLVDGALWRAGSGELLALLDGIESSMRRLHAASVGVIGEINTRGVAGELGAVSTRQLLQHRLRPSGRDASARMFAASDLPVAVEAAAAGDIGAEPVRVIGDAVRAVPADQRTKAEETLVGYARELNATELAKVARHLREVTNPDGKPPADDEHPRRLLNMTGDGAGGTLGSFRLDPEGAAALKAALDPLAAPRPETPEGKDRRSLAARRGDALVELAERALDQGDLPSQGGERPHIGVVIDFDKLIAELGSVTLETGDQLSVEALRRIACDAEVFPAVLRGKSEPIDIGRVSRTVPAAIRRLLLLRDKGCAFPGCTRPGRWCQAHHIRHWSAGGPTALGNLVLPVWAPSPRHPSHRLGHPDRRRPSHLLPARLGQIRSEPHRSTRSTISTTSYLIRASGTSSRITRACRLTVRGGPDSPVPAQEQRPAMRPDPRSPSRLNLSRRTPRRR